MMYTEDMENSCYLAPWFPIIGALIVFVSVILGAIIANSSR